MRGFQGWVALVCACIWQLQLDLDRAGMNRMKWSDSNWNAYRTLQIDIQLYFCLYICSHISSGASLIGIRAPLKVLVFKDPCTILFN